jgi:hypothetical protein
LSLFLTKIRFLNARAVSRLEIAGDPSMDSKPRQARDWSLLPLDALATVFVRLGAIDVLTGAGLVCRSWLDAAKVPDVWRVVDMTKNDEIRFESFDVWRAMTVAAVDRSNGQLRVFAGKRFVTEGLLQYIVERYFLLA